MDFTQGFAKLVRFANRFNHPGSSRLFCKPFHIDGKHIGFIRPDFLEYVRGNPDVFIIHENSENGDVIKVELCPELETFEQRSNKMAEVLTEWRKDDDELITLQGWRNECLDVLWKKSDPPLMKMERSATCLFGVKQFGVHINGFTRDRDSTYNMWIGRRSKSKATWPGKLDQMAAGAISSGSTIMQTAQAECREEAGVPDKLLERLKPVGTVSYFFEDQRGLFPECQFVMDLEVPPEFVPCNTDGEMDSFELVPVKKVKEILQGSDVKFDCAVVMLDFLIRHGLIHPDEEPCYSFLIENMHTKLH